MVSVAERARLALFGATEYVAVPLPVPLLEEVTQLTLLLACHVQPLPVSTVTVTLPLPPVAGKVGLMVGVIAKVHTPFCVTVTVCPARVIVPVREPPPVLAATK